MSLFERPRQSYTLDSRALGWILADAANPLNRVVDLIPDGATVLDIGAGNGILARLLQRERRDVTIDGVEPEPVAASMAAPHYRKLYCGPVESLPAEQAEDAGYDFIVMADVIEHLPNPDNTLRGLKRRLAPAGRMLISTPNVAFVSVRIALLNGAFDYVDSGILERTHLRFFTLSSLRALLKAVEVYPETTMFLKRNPLDMEIALQELSVGPFLFSKLLRDELASVYQFLFVVGCEQCQPRVESHGDAGSAIVLRYMARRLRQLLLPAARARDTGGS